MKYLEKWHYACPRACRWNLSDIKISTIGKHVFPLAFE
jgi:hypothetical protein